ncbi:hypothetical protein EYY60_17305 [Flavobacterium zhairuonense]|uniref:hypothetical protein n=1 Tax=Flavobacterium zhairuonense TaxID=2493631 RepID=UPI00104E1975|nr:hypothetical protein [Flavobacterium zhairuonense]KAF2507710.1 hypothetical protein EYY60_17305 [Flavobacterium zhairuonense]
MKIQKMSLELAKEKLSRKEMKTIMAGSYSSSRAVCVSTRACTSGCATTMDGQVGECNSCCIA